MAKYISGRQKNLKVGISSYSENLTSLEVVGNVGIATSNATSKLYVVGDAYFSGIVTSSGFYVSSELVSVASSFSQLYVSGISTLGITSSTNLTTQQLNVSGLSTFVGVTTNRSTFFGTQLSVSGVSTFIGLVDANGGAEIDNIRIGIANNNEIDTSTGNLVIDSAGGTVTIDDQLVVTGVSTFNNRVDIDQSLNVDNNITITGLSTFTGITTSQSTIFATQLNVSGVSTFNDNVRLPNNKTLSLGDSDDLQLVHDGSDSYIKDTGTGSLILTTNKLEVKNAANTETGIVFNEDGPVELYYDNSKRLETTGIGISLTAVSNGSATITGPSTIIVDPAGIGDNTGAVRIKGDLYVDGTQFVVNSSTIELADLRVGIATTVGSNLLLDGGGIGIGSDNILKTFTYNFTSDSLKSSENLDLASGKVYKINGTEVLSASHLTVANISASGVTTIGIASLSQLFVTGVSTFTGLVDANGGATIDNIQIGITGDNEIDTSTGNLIIDSAGGTVTIDDQLVVTGITTFNNNVDVDKALNVDGNVTVSGLSTFVGVVTTSGDLYVGGDLYVKDDLVLDEVTVNQIKVTGVSTLGVSSATSIFVTGVSTFVGVTTNRSTIFGTQLSVVGPSTFIGVTTNRSTFFGTQLSVSGVSTFVGLVDANGGAEIDNVRIGIANNNEIDTSTGNLVIDSAGGTVTIDDQLIVTGISTFNEIVDIDKSLNVDGNVTVSGLSTFVGVVTTSGDLFVGGDLYVKDDLVLDEVTVNQIKVTGVSTLGVSSATSLFITGVSTFVGVTTNRSTIFGTQLSVVGPSTFIGVTTNRSTFFGTQLSVSGVSTFVGLVDANGGATIDNVRIGVANDNEIDTSTGNLVIDSAGGTVTIDDQLVVTGISTFNKIVDIDQSLNVDGNVTVTGLSTFVGVVTTSNDLYVGGDLYVKDDLVLDEVTVNQIKVTGVSTLGVSSATSIFVTGVSTFIGLVDANGGATIDNVRIGVANDNTIDTSTGNLVIDSAGGTVTIDDQLVVTGVSTFSGTTEVNNSSLKVTNSSVSGQFLQITQNVDGSLNLNKEGSGAFFIEGNNIYLGDAGSTEIYAGFWKNGKVNLNFDNSTKLETVGYGVTVYGRLDTTQLNVSGISTFVGIGTFLNDLYVGGDLYVADDIFSDELTARNATLTGNLNVTGVSTFLGSITGTISTAVRAQTVDITPNTLDDNIYYVPFEAGVGNTSLYIDTALYFNPGQNLFSVTNIQATNIQASDINIIGVSTLGFANATTLSISGVSTFTGSIDANGDLDVDGHAELDNVNISGIVTTFDLVVDGHAELDNLNVSGVSTFTNGPVLVGSGTSTGTASQPLQVTGGAYVSGSVGIGTTNPGSTLDVRGDIVSSGNLLPLTDNTGVVGNASYTWSNGRFTDLTVDGTLTVRAAIDLADNDILRFGTGDDWEFFHNGTHNYMDLNIGNLIIRDNTTTRFTFERSSGNVGISSDTPTEKLDVAGNIKLTGAIYGPTELIIDPQVVGDNTGSVRIKGDLYVDGTQTVINSTTIELADFNVGIATTVGTNTLLDGAGIGIGSTEIRKTITWNNSASALTSSEDWNLVSGKQYEINGTSVLSSTTLGSGVVNSSLTSVGTLGQLNVSGITTSSRFVSNVATGTAPFTVSSTTVVTNLNADTVDGLDSTQFLRSDADDITTGQIQITKANNTATGGGQIYLNGATGNRIDFNVNGWAAPTFTNRSVGTKIVLYPEVAASNADYALGIESGTLWYSIPQALNTRQHRFYAGTTQLADLKGSGELVIGSTSLTGTASQRLQVTGGAYVSGNLGVGTTNPAYNIDVTGSVGITTTSGDALILSSTLSNGRNSIVLNTNGNDWEISAKGSAATPANSFYIYDKTNGAYRQVIDSSGNVLLGGATVATGTASQPLQVTGGAYVSGSVGIGSTNPTAKLDVQGGNGFIKIGEVYTGLNGITLNSSTSIANYNFLSSASDYTLYINRPINAPIRFRMNNSDQMVLEPSGNLGINSSSPTSRLDVVGDAKVSGVVTATSYNTIYDLHGSTTATTATTSQTSIHTLSSSVYSSVEYIIQAVESTNFHTTKILAVHNGTTVYLTEYGSVYNSSLVANYDVDISGGNIRLLATPASSSSTTFRISFTAVVL